MASVGQKNTGAEMLLRQALHRRGLRYRLHDRSLPGSPDIVFRRFNTALFVHGCYWHSHGCYRSTTPKTRVDFWAAKFAANRLRDERSRDLILRRGWRVLTVWECALTGKLSLPAEAIASQVETWLASYEVLGEIEGNPSGAG
ncbi:very short patch repair endonuclease [Neorhizobium galegae]|nr:very short patch repair endonuclease [Neorhizobium galegae]